MPEDLAKNPALSVNAMEKWLYEIDLQPKWRPESDRAADYYDGNQLDPVVAAELRERGQPDFIQNLIAPAIDGMLGMEAKTRTDWQVIADDDDGLEVADGLSQKLVEAERITLADKACSDAYAAQIKAGLGWVEVNRNSDQFKFKYRVNYVHRREIWWDWQAKAADLSDARWLLRRKWLDEDELLTHFPQHEELIEQIAGGWSGIDSYGMSNSLTESSPLYNAWTVQYQSQIDVEDWWDSDRRRALTYEVYYRVWDRRDIIKTEDGQAFVYDKKNKFHVAAVASGQVEIYLNHPYQKMRMAYFIGPHRVIDMDSPHPHNHFPYVPFWGFREDRTGAPYGLIRRMMPAQDEINNRRRKLTFLLNKINVIKDDDALLAMSDDDMMDELYKGDGVVNLNPNRQNRDANAFRIEYGSTISDQQFRVMQEAKQLIQDTGGIYASFLGQESGAKSGVAINSLVEQSNTTTGELNDNYKFARQLVGELLLANIIDDIGGKEMEIKVDAGNASKQTKSIVLNKREMVDGGFKQITNRVDLAKTRVIVADITSSPGYRQQLANSMMQMVSGLPPQYQAVMIDLVIEMTDIPNRDEFVKRIREASGQGINPEDMTPEQQQAAEQKAQMESLAQKLQFAEMEGRVEKLIGEARNINAKAAETEAKTADAPVSKEKTLAEIQRIRAEIKKIVTEVAVARSTAANAIKSAAQSEGIDSEAA